MKLLGLVSLRAARKKFAQYLHYMRDTADPAAMHIWPHRHVMNKMVANGGMVLADLKYRPFASAPATRRRVTKNLMHRQPIKRCLLLCCGPVDHLDRSSRYCCGRLRKAYVIAQESYLRFRSPTTGRLAQLSRFNRHGTFIALESNPKRRSIIDDETVIDLEPRAVHLRV